MANELSAEMVSELLNDMQRDAHILKEKIGGFRAFDTGLFKCSYRDLEDLSYLTAQIRLKLKVLGAQGDGRAMTLENEQDELLAKVRDLFDDMVEFRSNWGQTLPEWHVLNECLGKLEHVEDTIKNIDVAKRRRELHGWQE